MARSLRVFALLLLALPGFAHAALSGSIVDAAGAAKAMARGAVAWDVRSADKYREGHLPGAVNIGHIADALLDEKTQLFLPIEIIAARLGDAGIDLKREIVVYGDEGNAFAYFAEFALDYFGARKVNVFHDGAQGWRAAGRPLSTAEVKRTRVKVRPFANPSMLVTTGEVLARVGSPRVQFVDVRRLGEFNGDESETLHSGHIPGAVHIPYDLNLADRKLRRTTALRTVYADLDPRKETIVYCHTGVRAAMTAALLNRLGFRSVRVYHASWLEYGNLPDPPLEK
jgi:thiosulfate/3-mercaptopyruvate sulfurtransferase